MKKRREAQAEKKSRVEKAMRVLEGALDRYEADHPHWKAEALMGLIEWSLRSLRHYLEDAKDKEVTWAEPFVELPYAVEWDWNASRAKGEQHGTILYGQVTDQNVADEEKMIATLSKIMAQQVTTTALGDLTNWVLFADRGGLRRRYLPEHWGKALRSIKSKARREAAFEELFRPFSIGAGPVDYDGMEMHDGERVPPKAARQLAKLTDSIDLPNFRFTGEVEGRTFDARLVFQIHPLITDHDQEHAWHPITVGLFFEPKISGKRVTFISPARPMAAQGAREVLGGAFRGAGEIRERADPEEGDRRVGRPRLSPPTQGARQTLATGRARRPDEECGGRLFDVGGSHPIRNDHTASDPAGGKRRLRRLRVDARSRVHGNSRAWIRADLPRGRAARHRPMRSRRSRNGKRPPQHQGR